jgi:hypothetical protein
MRLRQVVSATKRGHSGAGPKGEGRGADTRLLADVATQVKDTRPIPVCAQRMVNA